MREEFEPFTQIYKKTDLRFEKVNDTLREFIRFGIAVQEKARGKYKLNKIGANIRDFINRIDELSRQRELDNVQENRDSLK